MVAPRQGRIGPFQLGHGLVDPSTCNAVPSNGPSFQGWIGKTFVFAHVPSKDGIEFRQVVVPRRTQVQHATPVKCTLRYPRRFRRQAVRFRQGRGQVHPARVVPEQTPQRDVGGAQSSQCAVVTERCNDGTRIGVPRRGRGDDVGNSRFRVFATPSTCPFLPSAVRTDTAVGTWSFPVGVGIVTTKAWTSVGASGRFQYDTDACRSANGTGGNVNGNVPVWHHARIHSNADGFPGCGGRGGANDVVVVAARYRARIPNNVCGAWRNTATGSYRNQVPPTHTDASVETCSRVASRDPCGRVPTPRGAGGYR